MLTLLPLLTALTLVSGAALDKRAPQKVLIHPGGNSNLCLTAADNYRTHGAVTLQNCGCGNTSQEWLVTSGTTQIALAKDTTYCVVGGVNALRGWFPGDGKQLETWSCKGDLSPGFSTWTFDNGKFKTTGQNSVIPPQPADNFCMDNRDGNLAPGNIVQYWTCFGGNANQQWTTTNV